MNWRLALVGLVFTGCYAACCMFWPVGACWFCKGSKKMARSPTGKFWRRCPVCKGSGVRVRWGRRAWGWFLRR